MFFYLMGMYPCEDMQPACLILKLTSLNLSLKHLPKNMSHSEMLPYGYKRNHKARAYA